MKPILFVWDFHGVLEKGNEFAVIEVMNRVLTEFVVDKEFTFEDGVKLYGQKWAEYMKYCAPDFPDSKLQEMVDKARYISVGEQVTKKYIQPNDDSHYVLRTIKHHGHTNILMSNSLKAGLDMFVDAVDVREYFEELFATDNHDVKDKDNPKLSWLKNEYLSGKDFRKRVVIDDRISGIEMGLEIGAVTYHYRRDSNFGDSPAQYTINDLKHILREVWKTI